MVITYDNRYAYSEMVEILEKLDIYYVEKLPIRLREFFTYNKLPDYVQHINRGEPLYKQNLSEKTVTILAILNLRYWVKDEEEKKELLNTYQENEKAHLEKYSTDNLFKKAVEDTKEEQVEAANLPTVIVKENIFKRIWNFIRNKIKK